MARVDLARIDQRDAVVEMMIARTDARRTGRKVLHERADVTAVGARERESLDAAPRLVGFTERAQFCYTGQLLLQRPNNG